MKLYLKIKPNQRFDKVERDGSDWIIRLAAPAVDGKANQQLVNYLSEVIGIAKSRIQLVKGNTSRIKCVEIDADQELIIEKLTVASKE